MKPLEHPTLKLIQTLFEDRGKSWYAGEEVTQLEHALQAATFAEQENAPPALIAAALLHDVGHLLHEQGEDCAEDGVNDLHEALAVKWLRQWFGSEVCDPIQLHVAAKRYRCAVDPDYLKRLSSASLRSLELQGGPFSETQAEAFRKHPRFEAALRLRTWDEAAKNPGLKTPPLEHFLPYLEECLAT